MTTDPRLNGLIIDGEPAPRPFLRTLHMMILSGEYRRLIAEGENLSTIYERWKHETPIPTDTTSLQETPHEEEDDEEDDRP